VRPLPPLPPPACPLARLQDIFSLTQRTVQGDEEDVVLQALEFWCTVAEEELDRDGVSWWSVLGCG